MEKKNSQLPSGLKTLRIFTLNLLIDSMFIAFSLSLLYSLRQYGKKEKEFSNTLFLTGIGFILFFVFDRFI